MKSRYTPKYIVHQNNHLSLNYAIIHENTCPYARKPGHLTKTTVWSDFFDTYIEALAMAQASKEDVRNCRRCFPNIKKKYNKTPHNL